MSAIATEDILEFSADYAKEQSEILFSTLPRANTQLNSHAEQNLTAEEESSVDKDSPVKTEPEHIAYLKRKLKLQQQRKKLVSEEQQRLEKLNAALLNTAALNNETEQRNVQAAVLMSALNQLQANIEQNQTNYSELLSQTDKLKQSGVEITQDLQESYEKSVTEHALLKTSNANAKTLITQLRNEFQNAQVRSKKDSKLSAELHLVLEESQLQLNNIQADAKLFIKAKQDAEAFQQQAKLAREEAEENNRELNRLLEKNNRKSEQLEDLASSLSELREELLTERDEQRALNERSKNALARTESINQQQTTLLELGNSRTQELEQELTEAVAVIKKYQTKLTQTESRLKETSLTYDKLKAQYGKTVKFSQQQEQTLKENTDALQLSTEQSSEFNSALKHFQQSSDQSQQLVLRSQSTLQNLLSRNDLLEKENRQLRERLNAMPMHGQFGSHPQYSNFDETPPTQNIAQDSLPNSANKPGFYGLMTALAIVLPLSLILHSMISNAGEVEPEPIYESISMDSSQPDWQSPFLASPTFTPRSPDSADTLNSNGR